MKNWLMVLAVTVAATMAVAPTIAEAKRFGGGGFSGMKRSLPATPPAKPAAPAQASPTPAGAAPAAAGRSWMGPIAGLAAGLGIAALMSHLGLSEEFGNFLMLALLALAAVFVVRWLMRRSSPQQPAAAGAGASPAAAPSWDKLVPAEYDANPRRVETAAASGATLAADGRTLLSPLGGQPKPRAAGLPAGFDVEGFERIAKMIFIRMQAANDAGDLNDLRSFTTPEMFAVAKLDLQDRAGKPQTTDVIHVDAEVLDLEQEGERQVVSVRFHGKIREAPEAPVEDFDEVWHLLRWGDSPSWSIAGIQQSAVH